MSWIIPISAISIASPSCKERHHGPHQEIQRANAHRTEHKLISKRQFVWAHHFIRLNWTKNRAATNTAAVMNMAR
jgi:hypothetical protein